MSYEYGEDQIKPDESDNDYLGGWCAEGAMRIRGWDPPDEAVQFILSQFERFRVQFPPELTGLINSCWQTLMYYLNHYDPYCMFSGLSEVQVTEDWQKFSYCLTPPHGFSTEIPAGRIETYKLYPGDDVLIFNDLMGKPGLGALPNVGILEEMFYEGSYFDIWDSLDEEYHEILNNLCSTMVNGNCVVVDKRKEAYAELGVWAALMFLISPDQRDLRRQLFPIIDCCYEGGECIIYENEIYDGTYYNKQARNPLSCSECGIVSWCVDLAQLGNISRYICEYCLNGEDGIQKRPYACGLKMCPVVRCPNHPQHGDGASGLGYYKTHGQLNSMTQENTMAIASKKAKAILT